MKKRCSKRLRVAFWHTSQAALTAEPFRSAAQSSRSRPRSTGPQLEGHATFLREPHLEVQQLRRPLAHLRALLKGISCHMPGAKGLRSTCATRYHFCGASRTSVSFVAKFVKSSSLPSLQA